MCLVKYHWESWDWFSSSTTFSGSFALRSFWKNCGVRNLAHSLIFELTAQKTSRSGRNSSLPSLWLPSMEVTGYTVVFWFLLQLYLFSFAIPPTELKNYIPVISLNEDLYLKFACSGGRVCLPPGCSHFLIIFSCKGFSLVLFNLYFQLVIKYIACIPVSLTTVNNCLTASP